MKRKIKDISLLSLVVISCALASYFFVDKKFVSYSTHSINFEENQNSSLAQSFGIASFGNPNKKKEMAFSKLNSRDFLESFINRYKESIFTDIELEKYKDIDSRIAFFRKNIFDYRRDDVRNLVYFNISSGDKFRSEEINRLIIESINEVLKKNFLDEKNRKIEYLQNMLAEKNYVSINDSINKIIEADINELTLAKSKKEYFLLTVDPPYAQNMPDFPKFSNFLSLGIVLSIIFSFIYLFIVIYVFREKK